MKKPTISVLGCGWLGFSLAQKLISEGFIVNGSTTSSTKLLRLEESGIKAFEIHLEPEKIKGDINGFLDSEILVLNIPPGRKKPNVATEFPQKVALLLSHLQRSPIEKILFVSSTSVYGHAKGIITPKSPLTPTTSSGKALVESEQYLTSTNFEVTILRPGGLVGGQRHPGRFLAGRKHIKNGDAPINLIHRDDVISIILAIIKQEKWGLTLNAAADKHPKKSAYYTYAAEKLGLEKPEFLLGGEDEKLISNKDLKEKLGYEFIYTDPYEMIS